MVELREMAENFIISEKKINTRTVCEYFMLADTHKAQHLKAATLEFIRE